MTSGAGDAIHEAVGSARAALRALARRAPEIVVGLGVALSVLVGLALVAAALDDRGIDARRVVTTAEVLEGSSFARTLVRFEEAGGQVVVPEHGVFYPRGTTPGQPVVVEYDAADPEQVRVAGRGVADQLLPTAAGLLAVWAVLGPLAVWLRRRRSAGHGPWPA